MLLKGLSQEQTQAVESQGSLRKYAQDELVIREGDEGLSIFLVRRGRVEVRKGLSDTSYKKLRQLGEGEFFGEISFLRSSPRSATVVALEETEILELKRADLDRLAQDNPAIGYAIYRNIAADLAWRLKHNTDDLKRALLWLVEGLDV